MENFNFYKYTNLIFGKNRLNELPFEIKKYTNKKILLTYGGNSAKKSGLYDEVTSLLNDNNIEFIELGDIKPNPRVSTCREGSKIIKENNIDFILAMGGGSVLDNSKHMAIASRTDRDIWEIMKNQSLISEIKNPPKIGAIITLAATGSEMNSGGVMTNLETNEKLAIGHPDCAPVFSFEDPTCLYTLGLYQKKAGVCDILSHLFEIYMDSHEDQQLSDRFVEAIMINVINNYPDYLSSTNYDSHSNIFASSTFALNGLTAIGRSSADWASHMIEHEISAYTDLTHGIGLSIVHPVVLEYYYEQDIKSGASLSKFINLGKNVFNLTGTDSEIAKAAVLKIKDLFLNVSKFSKLSDVEILDFNSAQSIDKLIKLGLKGNYNRLEKNDLENIFKLIK